MASLFRRRSNAKTAWQEAARCMPSALTGDACCPICLDNSSSEDVVRLQRCEHTFDKHCLDAWLLKVRDATLSTSWA